MKKSLSFRLASILLIAILTLPLSSCGLLIYPERQGQTEGQIDPTVAILDAIGLLFFIIPGVVAFAVDMHTGCIYFPEGEEFDSRRPLKKYSTTVRLAPEELTRENIESVLAYKTGRPVDLSRPDVRVYRMDDAEALAYFSPSLTAVP